MKPKQVLIPFLLISFIFVLSTFIPMDFNPRAELHFTKMEIEFDGVNATATIDYDVGFLTQVYIFLFGNRNLEPYLEDFLSDYTESDIFSISGTSAKAKLINSSRISGPYYVHDNRSLGSPVATLIMIYPEDPGKDLGKETLTYSNVSKVPSTFTNVSSYS